MTTLSVLTAGLLVAVVVVLAVWAWRRPMTPRAATEPWDEDASMAGARVVLDLVADDPRDPALQRLVRETALRALQSDATIDRVEVLDAHGRVLGTELRPTPLPEVALPDQLHEPQARRSRAPSVVPRPQLHGSVRADSAPEDVVVAARPFADRFDLPPDVRHRVRRPDRPLEVVRAILEAAGRPTEVRGDVIVSGDVAIAVVDPRFDPERALTHGFLAIRETGAPRGIVLRLGHVDPRVVRRREAAAPHVRHVAVDALQRMADAVAVGADPIAFAAAPALRR
ncbi:hypothetical protein [Egicoccus sp. AB-alg6-2]|uniref:hypothetical protein n=1 Tax=Egicoccus sp. AB-alg6-2 TaxID=3242692 RepID=UPI00359D2E66